MRSIEYIEAHLHEPLGTLFWYCHDDDTTGEEWERVCDIVKTHMTGLAETFETTDEIKKAMWEVATKDIELLYRIGAPQGVQGSLGEVLSMNKVADVQTAVLHGKLWVLQSLLEENLGQTEAVKFYGLMQSAIQKLKLER